MRILILNCDYPRFVQKLYQQTPGLASSSYEEQLAARNDSLFGVADFYSRNFRAHGHEAWEVHVNNPPMQAAWAREHGLDVQPDEIAYDTGSLAAPSFVRRARRLARKIVGRWAARLVARDLSPFEHEVLRAQIAFYQPDVILNQEMGYVRSGFLREVRGSVPLIVGQIAAALPLHENYGIYDFVVSSLPNFVSWFRSRGVHAEYNALAFEPSILRSLRQPARQDVDVSFVGSLSVDHDSRIRLLEYIAEHVDLKIWGNGIEGLPAASPLHRCYRGEAWGRVMYDVLMRSRVTINHHIDLAEGFANNMRLYEATGVGCLMAVDAQKNLADLFQPGTQVLTYDSPEHCLDVIRGALADEPARQRMALAGQQRTISEHNYARRTGELAAMFESRLREERRRA